MINNILKLRTNQILKKEKRKLMLNFTVTLSQLYDNSIIFWTKILSILKFKINASSVYIIHISLYF